MMPSSTSILLFSYGTLQKKHIQIANFGRELIGRKDSLPGYIRRILPTTKRSVMELTGESGYAYAEPSSNPNDEVIGTVFEITEVELSMADKYEEGADYHRIRVTLRSGDQAWVYIPDPTVRNAACCR